MTIGNLLPAPKSFSIVGKIAKPLSLTTCYLLLATFFLLLATPVLANPPSSQSWHIVFEDNFDGTSLNTNVWEPGWFGSGYTPPVNSYEENCYHPSQLALSGGALHITAQANSNSSCKDRSGGTADYISGLINSRNSFHFTYGYIEARLRLPGNSTDMYNWAAFWTDGNSWPTDGEIDVMESLSQNIPCWHYHYSGGSVGHCTTLPGPADWHTYAALWEPGKITFYYDGQNVGSVDHDVVSAQHYVIANYSVSQALIGSTNVPATMDVDYIRVWQTGQGGTNPTPTPTPTPTSTPAPCTGDINGNGLVDVIDYSIIVTDFLTSNPRSDLNGDGLVDVIDYSILVTDFLTSNPRSDLNGDGLVDVIDYSIFVTHLLTPCS